MLNITSIKQQTSCSTVHPRKGFSMLYKNFYRPTQKIMKVHILAIVLDENITRLHSKTILNELMLE